MNKNHLTNKNNFFRMIGKISIVLFLAMALTGCAHLISKETLKEVDQGIRFEDLRKNPETYKGKTVLLGGVIISTENKKDGTLLEVYQTRLNHYGEPVDTDVSQGRFLAMYDKFLDSEIFSSGREVTLAGVVQGVETRKLDEIDYDYPYIIVKEIHLLKEEQAPVYGPYYRGYWNPWWDPWYPWDYPYSYYPYSYYPYSYKHYQPHPRYWDKRYVSPKTQQQQQPKQSTSNQKNTGKAKDEK
jgi:outer membrane lipoprotein